MNKHGHRWVGAIALGLGLGALVGCGGAAPEPGTGETISDQGDFVLVYEEPSNPEFLPVYEALVDSEFYDALVMDLNDGFALPQDITIYFTDCGEENAFYDPAEVAVIMCYDLIHTYAEIFHEQYQEDYGLEVIYAGYFTFFHEVGHALVDQLALPIVGREEDAVDAFATILLLWWGETDAAIAAVEQFEVDAAQEEALGEVAYWGEHSLSGQRVYAVACLIYGSDPEGFEDWVTDGFLPEERAERCPDEFEQADQGWATLLAGALK